MLVLLCGYQGTKHSLCSTSFLSELLGLLFLLELRTLHNLIYCKGRDLSNLLVKGNVLPSKLPNGYSGLPEHGSGGTRLSDSFLTSI